MAWGGPQLILNLLYFSLKIWYLVATIVGTRSASMHHFHTVGYSSSDWLSESVRLSVCSVLQPLRQKASATTWQADASFWKEGTEASVCPTTVFRVVMRIRRLHVMTRCDEVIIWLITQHTSQAGYCFWWRLSLCVCVCPCKKLRNCLSEINVTW